MSTKSVSRNKKLLTKQVENLHAVSHFIHLLFIFIYLLFSHNKDYTSITLYKDVARGPQKTTRLVRGGPLVTIILSNRTITTHNNGQYKTHYRYSRKSKTFVLNDCNVKIEVTEFGKEFQILGPWNKIENCLVLVRQAWERKCEELLVL